MHIKAKTPIVQVLVLLIIEALYSLENCLKSESRQQISVSRASQQLPESTFLAIILVLSGH